MRPPHRMTNTSSNRERNSETQLCFRRRRPAFTLLETTLVLASLTILGATATQVLHQLAVIGDRNVSTRRAISDTERLAVILRSDARKADRMDIAPSGSITLHQGDRSVSYFIRENPTRVERWALNPDDSTGRESYRLMPNSFATWTSETEANSSTAVRLTVSLDADGVKIKPGNVWIIEGVVQ